jgi:exopolysaccharide biosynthesis WecB/TagA/CpsF family protein
MGRLRGGPLLPRWSIGVGYTLLWALGAGFLWLPLAAVRLVAARRWRPASAGIVVLVVVAPLVVSLGVALVRGASPSRAVAAVFLLVPWLLVALAAVTRWGRDDARRMARGLVDLALLQGLLVAAAQVVSPRLQEITLPLGRLLPDSVGRTTPLDAWTITHLAFPDFYDGTVTRTGGLFGNPTWAGAMAALALLCLVCRPRNHVDRRWWTWLYAAAAGAGSAVTLVYAYSRNDVLGLALGAGIAGLLAVLLRVSLRVRRTLITTGVLATVAAGIVFDAGQAFRDFNAPRQGSLEARQAIYSQTLRAIHHHSLLLGNGVKDTGADLVASLGSHSTYLGLVYRGGWIAFWGLILTLGVLLFQARLNPLAAGLVTFVILWCSAEDLDTGQLVPLAIVLAIVLLQCPEVVDGPAAVSRLAHELIDRYSSGERTNITWVNHWSAQRCLADEVDLSEFTLLGLDGNGLRGLLPCPPPRTSADLVLPHVLPHLEGARVALIGGTPDGLEERVEALTALLAPGAKVVAARDGYVGRLAGTELRSWVAEHDADVVLVALGAPLQERATLDIADLPGVVLVATCGGFLDQVAHGAYYPRWAYPLRLNWLVRVAREPHRLWRRYTGYVLLALVRRRRLRRFVAGQPGYHRCTRICTAAERVHA